MFLWTIVTAILFQAGIPQPSVSSSAWKDLLQHADSLSGAMNQDSAMVVAEQARLLAAAEYGPEDARVALCLNRLADFATYAATYSESERYRKDALSILVAVHGSDHPSVASCLGNLAVLYRRMGKYAEAPPLLERSLRIYEKTLGPQSEYVGLTLNNLAALHYAMGRTVEAEVALKRALPLWQEHHGLEHPTVALCLNNLAVIHRDQGRFAQAESLFTRVLDMRKRLHGPEHSWVAHTLSDLADLYLTQGRLEEAEASYQNAVEIYVKTIGPDHRRTAACLHGLADVYIGRHRFEEAEKILLAALETMVSELGETHYRAGLINESLSMLYRLLSRDREALDRARRSAVAACIGFDDNAMVLPEKDALTYSEFVRRALDNYISCCADFGLDDDQDIRSAASLILAGKGRVTEEMIQRQRVIVSEQDSSLLTAAQTLRAAKSQVAAMYAGGLPGKVEEDHSAWDSLSQVVDSLESELSRRSASFRSHHDRGEVDLERIASHLPSRSVLLEYVRYNYISADSHRGQAQYLVVVIGSEGDLAAVDLGPADPIDSLASTLTQHMRMIATTSRLPNQEDMEEYNAICGRLSQLILSPVQKHIADKDLLLVAPDGRLCCVAFAGLLEENGEYLLDRFSIHYVSSGRDIARFSDDRQTGTGLFALGDPDFGGSGPKGSRAVFQSGVLPESDSASVPDALRSFGVLGEYRVPPLPASRLEIERITSLWREFTDEPAVVYLGSSATEENFKAEAPGKRILHLATHGFFLEATEVASETEEEHPAGHSLASINPLLLSGLVLAETDPHPDAQDKNRDDGILTAYEVTELNLDGAALVVLSACESGMGRVVSGEGVYGLRRAFQLAGARTVVTSLWPVPDNVTADFMKHLYSRAKTNVPAALRHTALAKLATMRKRGQPDHPYLWAAFIAVGDWRGSW